MALIACLIVFILLFSAFGSFENYLAQRELASQAAMMLRGFREGYERARADLEKLPSVEQLNCQDGMSEELALDNFSNLYIRWFGVARNGNVICKGTRVAISLADIQVHQIDDVWSLLSLQGPAGRHDLVVAQRRGDTLYLAILEPLLFDFLHSVDCNACVSYNFLVKASPLVDMVSQPTSSPAVISYSVEGTRLGTDMKFTLNASQQYVDAFMFPGRLMSAAIAAIIAAAFGFAMYKYMMRRTSIAYLMQQGLKHNEFLPYYQPIVDCRDGTVIGAEALARWLPSGGAMMPPDQFLPYAEEHGFIGPITDQIVERVLADLVRFGWQNTDHFLSINAIAEQITDSPFCSRLVELLAEKDLPSRNLCVEITERHQFADLERGRIALRRLVDAGIKVELDDAGTGFGGFAYVQELPFSTLKIDKMFIDTLRKERADPKRDVLHAIIEFATVAGLEMIAEGVETNEQVAQLEAAGVYAIQGFVYARPMPAEEFVRWLQRGNVASHLGRNP
jgi:sensor c-di-GMP phosphodiesterase-like protein